MGGCGDSEGPTRLSITYFDPISVEERTYSVSCDPLAGTVRDPRSLCESLGNDDSLVRAGDLICTGDFHSPYLSIRGTLKGEAVESDFGLCRSEQAAFWLKQIFPATGTARALG